MADNVTWGSKDFLVPEYFNFVDVIDEWALKEQVTGARLNDYFYLFHTFLVTTWGQFPSFNRKRPDLRNNKGNGPFQRQVPLALSFNANH